MSLLIHGIQQLVYFIRRFRESRMTPEQREIRYELAELKKRNVVIEALMKESCITVIAKFNNETYEQNIDKKYLRDLLQAGIKVGP